MFEQCTLSTSWCILTKTQQTLSGNGSLSFLGCVSLGKFESGLKQKFRDLRTFAQKSSNIDFFIKLLLQLGYE